jgi:anti-repressor protein
LALIQQPISEYERMGKTDFAPLPVPFLFEGQHLVRVLTGTKDELWFVAADVCRVLRLSNTTAALKSLDLDEKGLSIVETLGGRQELNTISEPGLYQLIGRSRKPAARRFDRFVRHDVLPAIRRTGRFEMDPAATKLNTQAVNAVSRAVGEVRRSLGPRAAAKALPEIFAKAGIRIVPRMPDQGELGLEESELPEND